MQLCPSAQPCLCTSPSRLWPSMASNPRTVQRHRCHSNALPVANQASVQEALVAFTVVGLISASFFNGIRGEPIVCDSCQGKGGARCFACSGSGLREVTDAPEFKVQRKRDFVGRSVDPTQCKACFGTGMTLCRQCRGTGYTRRL